MGDPRPAAPAIAGALICFAVVSPALAALPPAPVFGHPAEYVVVTAESLAPEFERLARFKNRLGVPALVQTLEQIRLDYPAGRDDAERVRLYLQDARAAWGSRYVLLGGDATVVPVRHARTQFYGGGLLPSDLYYAALDGDWNADGDALWGEGYQSASNPGDAADLTADVFVGRAPVQTAAEAHGFVDKAIGASFLPVEPRAHGVLLAAEAVSELPNDGAELAEALRAHLDDNPDVHAARLYENWMDPRWVGASPLTHESLLDSLRAGYELFVHVGGGDVGSLGLDPPLLSNADAPSILHASPTVAYSMSDWFASPETGGLGRALMQVPNGGVHAVLGPSWFPFPTSLATPLQEFVRLLYDEDVSALGEAAARQVDPLVPYSAFDGVHRWTVMTSMLLGDPEVRPYVRVGVPLAVNAPGALLVGSVGFALDVTAGGSAVANARVSAWIADEQLVIATTDAMGHATVPLEVTHAGTCELTVTSPRGERRAMTIPMVEPVGVEAGIPGRGLSLGVPTPNPAADAMRLTARLGEDVGGRVALDVHDLSGRLVRRLWSVVGATGRFDVTWDLRAADGATVPGGLYFLRLHGERGNVVRRVSVLP